MGNAMGLRERPFMWSGGWNRVVGGSVDLDRTLTKQESYSVHSTAPLSVRGVWMERLRGRAPESHAGRNNSEGTPRLSI